MSREFPNTEEWLPELGYKTFIHPEKRCATCKHSYCHNPGAYITGLSCKIIKKLLKKIESTLPIEDKEGNKLYYTSVVSEFDICDKYKGN